MFCSTCALFSFAVLFSPAPASQDGTSSPSTDMSSAGTTVTSKGTDPAGPKPPEPHRIGLSPLDRGRNAGRLDVNPLPEPRPANPWPEPRPHGTCFR